MARFGLVAWVCLFAGSVLVLGALGLMAWTERQAVRAARVESDGAGSVLEVPAQPLDAAARGRLVHFVGPLLLAAPLTDRDFMMQARGAVKLVRHAEMFQWKRTGVDQYATVWSDEPIDSDEYAPGHRNPLYSKRSLTLTAPRGAVGAFTVDYESMGQLTRLEPMVLASAPPGARLLDGGLYVGADPVQPAVGDMRVRYSVVRPTLVSALGMQVQGALRPFPISDGRRVLMMREGDVSAATMMEETGTEGSLTVWGMRVAAWLGLLVGFRMLSRPAAALGKALEEDRPGLHEVMVTGPFLIALAATVLVGILLTGGLWVTYRPFQGAWLIGVGMLAVFQMVRMIRARREWLRPVEYTPPRTV